MKKIYLLAGDAWQNQTDHDDLNIASPTLEHAQARVLEHLAKALGLAPLEASTVLWENENNHWYPSPAQDYSNKIDLYAYELRVEEDTAAAQNPLPSSGLTPTELGWVYLTINQDTPDPFPNIDCCYTAFPTLEQAQEKLLANLREYTAWTGDLADLERIPLVYNDGDKSWSPSFPEGYPSYIDLFSIYQISVAQVTP